MELNCETRKLFREWLNAKANQDGISLLEAFAAGSVSDCPECARLRAMAYDAEGNPWQARAFEAQTQADQNAMRVHALEEENTRLKALCDKLRAAEAMKGEGA